MTFLVITCFYDFLVALRMSQITPRLSCSLTPHFRHKNFLTTFFTILPKLHFFLSKNSDDLFLVITPFLRFSVLPYFHILHMMNPIPIFCTLYTPYIHTHMLFLRFCTSLCALVTVHTAYTIYFVLIHHCTNSLSSLHIFVHRLTFHTKTSPDIRRDMLTARKSGD